MEILVVNSSSIGSIVFALPCFRALRSHWPQARIRAAVNPEFTSLFEDGSLVDGLVIRERIHRVRRLKTVRLAAWAGCRNRHPRIDLAIDLQGNFHSAIWTYCSGARRMAGLGGRRPGWEFSLPKDHSRHTVDENAAVLEALGIPVLDRRPKLRPSQQDNATIAALLRHRGLPERGFLAVHPFTAWASKEWPIERYAGVLNALGRRPRLDLPAIVTGSSKEANRALDLCRSVAGLQAVSLAGELTLGQSLALWSRAGFFLGGDTGALHASAALGVSTLSLFGPTWPEVSGPVGEGHRVIQASRPATHDEYRAPGAGRHMMAISEAMVLEALGELLP